MDTPVEGRALNTHKGDALSHWLRCMDNTWMKIKDHRKVSCTDHISGFKSTKFNREEMSEKKHPFLDGVTKLGVGGTAMFTGSPPTLTSASCLTHHLH